MSYCSIFSHSYMHHPPPYFVVSHSFKLLVQSFAETWGIIALLDESWYAASFLFLFFLFDASLLIHFMDLAEFYQYYEVCIRTFA